MALNKFEKHIKKQLEEREIAPSTDAWERLSVRLDATAPQSNKRNVLWYGIAASFIGILMVSVVYFSSGGPDNTADSQIVETNEEVIETKAIPTGTVAKDIEEVIVEKDQINKLRTTNDGTRVENRIPELNDHLTSVDESAAVIDTIIDKAGRSKDFGEEVIYTKLLEIVATVDSLEQNNTALTNAEVDRLLRNAQEQLLRDKLFEQNGSVDAMALLTEVENEMDQSFRDQIFESLKAGFLKVRTAVADRNK